MKTEFVINIDARGADPGAVARLQAAITSSVDQLKIQTDRLAADRREFERNVLAVIQKHARQNPTS